jgi:hypothetical protein
MIQKITLSFLIGVSILLYALSYFLLFDSQVVFFCGASINCESNFWIFSVAKPLYWGVLPLVLLFVFMLLARGEVFETWWKVALPVGIIFILIAIWAPPLPDMFTPDRTWVTKQLSLLFVAISALVVGWKYWVLSKH